MAYVNAVLGLTDHPVAFQFLFVRDFFLTVLLSPALWLSLRHPPGWEASCSAGPGP